MIIFQYLEPSTYPIHNQLEIYPIHILDNSDIIDKFNPKYLDDSCLV